MKLKTVGELIEWLQKQPLDRKVGGGYDGYGCDLIVEPLQESDGFRPTANVTVENNEVIFDFS